MTVAHVVGGTVAALSAARSLARRGVEVVVSAPPGPFGGGFSPLTMSGRTVELGCRVIELSYDAAAVSSCPPLSDYRPGPHGHRPYTSVVADQIRCLAGGALVEISAPVARVGDATVRDWVFDGDLAGVVDLLSPAERATMRRQAVDAVERWGSRGWFDPAFEHLLGSHSLMDAGHAHMGVDFFDKFVDAFASRIVDGGSAVIEASLHRKIWLPLFWPSTVLEALDGDLGYRPDRPLFTIVPQGARRGGMGALVQIMHEELAQDPGVTILERSLSGIECDNGRARLAFDDGTIACDELVILAGSPRETFGSIGIDYRPEMSSVSLAWIELPDGSDVPAVMWIGDRDRPVFRISRSWVDEGPPVLCCELAWWAPADLLGELAAQELVRSGIVPNGTAMRHLGAARRDAMVVASQANRVKFDAARRTFDQRIAGVVSCGPAVAFAVDSFNEQLIGGMAAADRWLDAMSSSAI